MAPRDRQAFGVALIGANMYVPAMAYSSDLVEGQPTPFSLGSPAAASATAIASAIVANATAGTIEHYETVWTSDARYGRSLKLTPSGNPGNSFAIKVHGRDYLGQNMTETFTGASGSTSVLYGKKCFYGRIYTEVVTAASNAITAQLGTHTFLGLPYKSDVEWVKEGGVLIPHYKRDLVLGVDRPAALAAAGGSVFVRTPCPGFIKNLRGFSYGAGSTNDPVITVKLATVTLTGLTVTIDANVSTTAAVVTGTPTTAGYNANNRLSAGDVIEIVGAAATSAAGDRVEVTVTPTQCFLGDTTDPATATTTDPRGFYDPVATLNGSTEIIVGLLGDNAVNASGNGGLHGIAQV